MNVYRINYGNGQVSRTFRSKKDADVEFHSLLEYSRRHGQSTSGIYIQKYMGEGEWFRSRNRKTAKSSELSRRFNGACCNPCRLKNLSSSLRK